MNNVQDGTWHGRVIQYIQVAVCANNLTGEYSLLDPSTFDLPSLSSSIPVKQIGVNRPHPGGVGQRPSDA
ncbi:unnamed protein product [Prunus armeniaca]